MTNVGASMSLLDAAVETGCPAVRAHLDGQGRGSDVGARRVEVPD